MNFNKNKKLTRLIPGLLVLLFFNGCDRIETVTLKTYVTSYSVSRDFELRPANEHGIKDDNTYLIRLWRGDFVNYASEGKEAAIFQELSQKYGDTSYREKITPKGGAPRRVFFSEPIAKIVITCDKDIDEKHPAGSSLNDLFLFFSGSPDKYIQNGYTPLTIDVEKEIQKVDDRLKEMVKFFYADVKMTSELVYGKTSDLDFTQYKLMGAIIWDAAWIATISWIIPPPESLSDYTLSVEIDFVDGLKKTATIEIEQK